MMTHTYILAYALGAYIASVTLLLVYTIGMVGTWLMDEMEGKHGTDTN
jgi:hypothetical protein